MTVKTDVPYVVATASIAQRMNEECAHHIRSVNQLIESRVSEGDGLHVVGTANPSEDGWLCDRYTFRDLYRASNWIAGHFLRTNSLPQRKKSDGKREMTVALLASSSIDFLVNWLAMLRLGLGVLFIAPQCSAEAVAHLIKATHSSHLLHDERYRSLALAASAKAGAEQVHLLQIVGKASWRESLACDQTHVDTALSFEEEGDTTAIIFHTSGSSGLPKPVYGKHSVWTEKLPQKFGPPAFTTTPLYHGGTADLMRALMGNSMIYLFTSEKPITATNVVASVLAAEKVAYFLAVPYILKLLAEDSAASEVLATMEMISVGGAPLSDELGDHMVKDLGWKLVSRMGSSEAGFLMSSWRDFEEDKDWTYLRHTDDMLIFEDAGNDLAELIVPARWPTLNKCNRQNGDFATGDLYKRHATKSDAWRYHGRSDDSIVLSNGEKFSASQIESILRADPNIQEVVVFGADRPHPCAIIFPSDACESAIDSDIISHLQDSLRKANADSPSFAYLSADMVRIERDISRLPRSSKGTVQRPLANDVFQRLIDALYTESVDTVKQNGKPSSIDDVHQALRAILSDTLQRGCDQVDVETDLFAFGINSLQATRIRKAVMQTYDLGSTKVPTNIVFENPSIKALALYVWQRLNADLELASEEAPSERMQALVQQYSCFDTSGSATDDPLEDSRDSFTIEQLLTGATGALGAHLLSQIKFRHPKSKIVCLCRAKNDADAEKRVMASLQMRKLPVESTQVICLAADLTLPNFGLQPEQHKHVEACSTYIHAAWPVNFNMHLTSFQSALAGLHNLLQLAITASASAKTCSFLFCSSIASVLGPDSRGPITENVSSDPNECGPLGYSQSKWVAEAICAAAAHQSKVKTSIARIGQLCGDSMNGIWNTTEAWPQLIRTAGIIKSLPLIEENVAWLAVDVAASVLLDILGSSDARLSVTHVYHPSVENRWPDILEGLRNAGLSFDAIQPEDWLQKLDNYLQDHSEDPASQLYALWHNAVGIFDEGLLANHARRLCALLQYSSTANSEFPIVDVARARALSKTFASNRHIDSEVIQKMASHWISTGFLNIDAR